MLKLMTQYSQLSLEPIKKKYVEIDMLKLFNKYSREDVKHLMVMVNSLIIEISWQRKYEHSNNFD